MRKLALTLAVMGLAGFLLAGDKDRNKSAVNTTRTATVTTGSQADTSSSVMSNQMQRRQQKKIMQGRTRKMNRAQKKEQKRSNAQRLNSSLGAQNRRGINVQGREKVQNRGRQRSFVDEDGDGINDLMQDADGDGIPNGKDPDWTCPGCHSKQQAHMEEGRMQHRHGEHQGMHNHECPHSGGSMEHQKKYEQNDHSTHHENRHTNDRRNDKHNDHNNHNGGSNNHHG